jgi:CDP-L-myo-inositol myo-inositolphosphotransferase
MKCLILAAGKGLRLKSKCETKPLASLLGLTLIERVILTACQAGFSEFYVVTGYNEKKVREQLNQLKKTRNIKITVIHNSEWEKENGVSVLKAEPFIKENFILLMSDHIFDAGILLELKNQKIKNQEVLMAVDYNTKKNSFVDFKDATKVKIQNNTVTGIGKKIKEFNGLDAGIFLCSPAIFNAIKKSSLKGDNTLSGGIRVLARKRKVKAFDIKGSYWIDVDNESMLKKAESVLLMQLKKNSDGPVSRHINRPISLAISKRLAKTNINPNFISFSSFMMSMTAALFFFLGGQLNLIAGGILAQFSSIIDGCDGEIARLKFKATEFGAWFDAVLDRYADAFLLFGLIYYVYSIHDSFLHVGIGFLAVIGSFMNSYTADKCDSLTREKLNSKRQLRIGRDIRIFILFIGAIANQPVLALALTAVLTNTENIKRIILVKKSMEKSNFNLNCKK